MCDRRESFPHFTVWSDKAAFHLKYTLNRQNWVYWAIEKPNVIEEAVNLSGTSMWCRQMLCCILQWHSQQCVGHSEHLQVYGNQYKNGSTRVHKKKLKLNSVAFSSQVNYTDRATPACWRNQCQLLQIEGVAWSAQRITSVVNSVFLTGTCVHFNC
jgi:hypothetical protein